MKHPNLIFCAVLLFISTNSYSQISTFPYYEYFPSNPSGWTTSTISGTAWELGVPTASGSTVAYSPPNCWGTNLDSMYRPNTLSYLTSPKFHISSLTEPIFSFYQYRLMSSGIDGMHLEYSLNDTTWQILGDQPNAKVYNWYNDSSIVATGFPAFTGNKFFYDVSATELNYLGNVDSIRIRFVFTSDINSINTLYGINLDDFRLFDNTTKIKNLTVLGIWFNQFLYNNLNYSIPVNIRNTGSAYIDTVYYSYSINGVNSSLYAYPIFLLPQETVSIMIPNVVFPLGFDTMRVHVYTNGEIDTTDNRSYGAFPCFPASSLPYSNNFEIGNGDWLPTANSIFCFEYGAPNFGATTGAHSGINCWDTRLNIQNGSSSQYAFLYTDKFDISTPTLKKLSFWLNYKMNAGVDGASIEYTLDDGNTWQRVGNYIDTNSVNWYTHSSISSSGLNLPGWSGNSGGWKKSSYRTYFLQGQSYVQFRFKYTCAANSLNDGISIDDFSFAELPDNEIEIISISTPSKGYALGFLTDSITIQVKNNGAISATNFNYEYSVNGNLLTTATFTGILNEDETISLKLPGFYITTINTLICGKIILTNDVDTTNNNLCMSLVGAPTYSINFSDNFDSNYKGWYSETPVGYTSFWELGTPNYGSTNSALSPPNAWDIALDTAYSYSDCQLYSPFFDLSTGIHPQIKFWYNCNTFVNNGMRVECKSNTDTVWKLLGGHNDPNGVNWNPITNIGGSGIHGWAGNSQGWKQSFYELDSANLGDTVQFKFCFNSAFPLIGDGISIDNFSVNTIPLTDAQLYSGINIGPNAIFGQPTPIKVYIKNKGSQALTNLDIVYSINGGAPVTFNWTGNLLTDSLKKVTLPSFYPDLGINNMTIYIDWPLDSNNYNDTLKATSFGLPTEPLPYNNFFNLGSTGWTPTQTQINTKWELGLPLTWPLITTHSGNACWDINLNLPYFNVANATLTSPIFSLTPYDIITIQFWLNYDSETDEDGVFIEYSTDANTWNRLGQIGDPSGTNWYNTILTQSQQGWSGVNTGWQNCAYIYNKPFGIDFIQLRFKFISDISVVGAGASIDDFSITGVTSVQETNQDKKFVIYPNPANDEIIILSTHQEYDLSQVNFISLDGKFTLQISLPNQNSPRISTAQLTNGIYLLELINSKGEKNYQRVSIQH